ncbi:uncharacterized protein LOC119766116 [Culex quinquefasciatus]|uniref:uncharacterized protein LOC119766116 n=1 Tax=Culex quinquefasciatus TaxID=7176 RepID=UPI0018E3CD1C|nr:uncharacterized protein LOC119766116 [Culex quinquefasciatus]
MFTPIGRIRRACNNCNQFSEPQNMAHCPGCSCWFHVHCLGVHENIFKPGWRCLTCLAAAGPPASESTTIAPNATTTSTTATSSGGSILTEQAKADLHWIANQRELLLRDVERQQLELERKKEKLERAYHNPKLHLLVVTSLQEDNQHGALPSLAPNIFYSVPASTQTQGLPQGALQQGQPQGWLPGALPQGAPQGQGWLPQAEQLQVQGDQLQQGLSLRGSSQGQWQGWSLEAQSQGAPSQGLPQGHPQGLPQDQFQQWPQILPQGAPLQGLPQGGPPDALPQGAPQGQLQGGPQRQDQPQQWPQQGSSMGGPSLGQGLPPQGWPPQGQPQGWPPLGEPQRDQPQQWPPRGWPPQGQPQGWPPQGQPQGQPQGPSPQQLLARQVMPKDLPIFRGDPDDWPLFLSAYNNSTNACGYTNVENLARLQKAVQGKALDRVKNRLVFPACVPQVMSTLYMFYGRPEVLIQTLLDKLRETPSPKADRLETLINFGMAVQNLCDHIEASGQLAHLYNPVLLRELVEKLPTQQRLNWAFFKQQFAEVDLRAFAAYMSVLVAAASEVTVVSESKRRDRNSDKSYLNAHSVSDQATATDNLEVEQTKNEVRDIVCLACNGSCHKVKDCISFKKWDSNARWELVKDNHLCRTCLGKHGRRPCRKQSRCGVDGCQERHHQLLHTRTPTAAQSKHQTSPKEIHKPPQDNERQEDGLSAHHATKKSTLFRILPVTLSWQGKSIDTFAFLDDGSDLTLVEHSIAEQLGIDDGEQIPLCLSWTSNVTRQEPQSLRICLEVSGKDKKGQFTLSDTRTVASLDLPKQTLRYADLARQYPYLRGLPVSSYEAASPGILIGSNNAGLIATLSLREGQLGEPLASKTRLGWTVYGCSAAGLKTTNYTLHVCKCQSDGQADQDLHELVKRHFAIESIGVSAEKGPESEEDKRARNILEATTKRVSNRFETGLLWRHDDVKFPNSFPMAMRRLECFERRLAKDPELKSSVERQIREYLDNKYIHEVTPDEMKSADPNKVWHLPLGAVRNPKKPGKIRLVWDAAAKVGNVSLNSMLLKGPDQLKPLASVLRERPVAVCGDLKQMFHQFRIRQDDVQSQRFLYRDNPSGEVKTFAMDYIKNLNATEHAAEFPEAAKAIVDKHYVDDYLDSFDSEAEAIKVALEVKEVHTRGGFEIRNWHSNSNALLERVGEPKQAQSTVISIDAESEAERVLGLLWLPEEDVLAFATQLQLDGIPPTKRNILRCVMSLFDSQGILSHITIQGRMIIQDTWRNKTKWDDEVIEAIRIRWLRWTKLFKRVGEMKLHRAYFPGFSAAEVGSVELHVFTDASEEAYACTAYFRVVINGKVYITLAMAKAKVAPLKVLSVPRLELMGALLGARLAKAVMEYHTYPICRRVFWTDSKTTLAWINSHHRRYRQFVAFRVGEILSKTDSIEWRYVPTLHNPADEATKWGKGPSTDVQSRWFQGPDFLYLPEAEWPAQATSQLLETEEEL